MEQKRHYFYSLNTMRFFFALIVILIHVELYRGYIFENTLVTSKEDWPFGKYRVDEIEPFITNKTLYKSELKFNYSSN